MTGLAVLAFQAGGHYDFNNRRIFRSASATGSIGWWPTSGPTAALLDRDHGTGACNMYEHGIAAFALADACEMAASLQREPFDRYRQATQKAVQFIHYAQHDDGGWRYTEDDRDGHERRFRLRLAGPGPEDRPPGRDQRSQRGLHRPHGRLLSSAAKTSASGRTFYQPGHNLPSDAPTAIGMLVHQFILEQPDSPLVASGAKLPGRRGRIVVQARPQAAEEKAIRRGAGRLLHVLQRDPGHVPGGRSAVEALERRRSRPLVDRQCGEDEGCRRGSWDPTGRWSPEGGRVYSTALAVLTLEVYYRYKSERAKVYTRAEGRRTEGMKAMSRLLRDSFTTVR